MARVFVLGDMPGLTVMITVDRPMVVAAGRTHLAGIPVDGRTNNPNHSPRPSRSDWGLGANL